MQLVRRPPVPPWYPWAGTPAGEETEEGGGGGEEGYGGTPNIPHLHPTLPLPTPPSGHVLSSTFLTTDHLSGDPS